MFAFKVLNLNNESRKLIFILCSVSLGLFSLLLSSGYDPFFISFPFIHLPFYALTLILLFFYGLSGDTFYKITTEKKKGKNFKFFSFLAIYSAVLLFPFLLFKNCLFLYCIILSGFSFFPFFRIRKSISFVKDFFPWAILSVLIILYFFYISVFSIFIY